MSKKIEAIYGAVVSHALSLPEAWEDFPWGERVVKVKKKVFVFFGQKDTKHEQLFLCVKLPASGQELLREEWAEPAGYGLGKSGWVYCRLAPKQLPKKDTLFEWIEESYQAVAPKTLARRLDP